MSNIGKELAKQAKKQGICEGWYSELRCEQDIDKMLDMYVKGIDFCLSNDYPSNDYIRKNFKGKMESHGLHLDERLNIVNERKVISLGKCFGTVEVSDFTVSEVFVKHDSEIILTARDNSFVVVDVFDNAKLTVYTMGSAKVRVNKYTGPTVTVYNGGISAIKIVEKNTKTY